MKNDILNFAALVAFIFAMLFLPTVMAQSMYQNEYGQWVNEAGGNIYGDSNLNWQANPKMNWKADPRMNWEADPNMNWRADPSMNWQADPSMSWDGDQGGQW